MLLPNHFAKGFRAPFARQYLITHARKILRPTRGGASIQQGARRLQDCWPSPSNNIPAKTIVQIGHLAERLRQRESTVITDMQETPLAMDFAIAVLEKT